MASPADGGGRRSRRLDAALVLRLLGELRETQLHVERAVRQHPLDPLDIAVLALAEQLDGELRPSLAADRLETPAPSITRHIRTLQRSGYVSIQPDAADRRSYRIGITATGSALLGDFRSGLLARFTPVLRGWSNDEVLRLVEALGRLNRAMSQVRAERERRASTGSWWRVVTAGCGAA